MFKLSSAANTLSCFILSFLVLIWHNMTKMAPKTTARSIPKSLAPVVESLELRQPKLVTKSLLAEIIAEHGLEMRTEDVAHRLQKEGWLLSLRKKKVWEFAPASRAGRIDSGDLFIELRALLDQRPTFPISIAYESAAFLHGFAQRLPQKEVIAIPSKNSIPKTLKTFRITRMWGNLERIWINELPIWSIETLIVLMAARPTSYKAWPNVYEWLEDALKNINDDLIFKELESRPRSTWVRTGYLAELGRKFELGEEIYTKSYAWKKGPYYFGPRNKKGKYNHRWDIVDSLLT